MGDAGDSASNTRGDPRRFAAFISYSHADADAAAKLQRRLERYRLPKRIAEARANTATILGPIFRDREDLAAAASLSAAIRDAIGRAEALVVICSPDAAASSWVAAEIDLFRELHPERPILAALLSGEPAASFPAALNANGNEPLAADLRAQGDGEQLGFLKIVAGIAGVPLDTLIQRDAQRRIRRVTAITGGALAAMLIMAIMTTLALQARNEAARQRAAAEGLVEYMLTDLREKLKGVGRLDVQEAVNARMMTYYAGQGSLANLPADSLDHRARILHLIGEDYENQNELAKATSKFAEAHRVTATLLAKEPTDPKRIFSHAQSEYWLGHPAELSADWPTALKQYRAYSKAAERLIKIEPANPDYMMEMGWSALNVGIVLLQSRREPDFGDENFETAILWFKAAQKYRPNDPAIDEEIGNGYAWLADSRYLKKDFRGSLVARSFELDVKQRILVTDPRNTEFRFAVAKAKYAVAANHIKLGDVGRAKPLFVAAKEEMTKLQAIEPTNHEWKSVSLRIDESLAKMRRKK
jgi:MTH538 TIR-like domain (DUF1863)